MGANIGAHGQAIEWAYIPDSHVLLTLRTGEVEKPPFQISDYWLEVDENVRGVHFMTHRLSVK